MSDSRVNVDEGSEFIDAEDAERGPGRPEVGPAINIRLDVELLARVDAYAAAADVSRAAAIRMLLASAPVLQADPDADVVARAVQWQRRIDEDGRPSYEGKFDYPMPWDEPMSVTDWAVYLDRVGENSDTKDPHTGIPYWGALGDPAITLVLQNSGGGSGQTMSAESAEALGRVLLAAPAVLRRGPGREGSEFAEPAVSSQAETGSTLYHRRT